MLNDHMLVRIGGGWDTLEHYLMTHVPSKQGTKEIKLLYLFEILALAWLLPGKIFS